MGKKKGSALALLYLIGMALVAIGFCCPMFTAKVLGSSNGFSFIDFEDSTFVTIGALLVFIGAVGGVVSCFVPQLKGLKLIFLLCSIVGGIVLVIGFTTNGGVYKFIGKQLFKHATYGFYMILAGWVIAIVGYFSK